MPILVYVIGQGVHEATATSLVIVGATALCWCGAPRTGGEGGVANGGALRRRGDRRVLRWSLAQRASGPLILLLFGTLMLFVAARMALRRDLAEATTETTAQRGFHWTVLAAGLVVGVMTGFFGVGGGFLIVPALVLVLGFPMRLAVGTSLLIIAINSGAGALAHLSTGGFDLPLALLFIIGGVAGATFGGRLAGRIDEAELTRGFAALVALVGLYLIVRNFAALDVNQWPWHGIGRV